MKKSIDLYYEIYISFSLYLLNFHFIYYDYRSPLSEKQFFNSQSFVEKGK